MSRPIVLAFLAALALSFSLRAQAPAASALQGRWVVAAAEHQGKPFDVIKGGVMTITGNEFEVRTASGNMLKGRLALDPKQPSHLDMLHADGARWEAIFAVDGDTLRLNYVEAGGKEPRPTAFATTPDSEATSITLLRENR